MGIAQNARSIQRVVWVDEQGAPHIILLAYLGDKVIWDGHISQTVQVPRALSFSQAYAPDVLADAMVAVPLAQSYSEALIPAVTGGVTIAPPVAMSTSQAYAPTLFSDQIIDIPVALSTSQAYAPEIRVVFGVTPPVALSSSQAYAPVVHADSAVTPPRAQSYSQAYAPVVGSYAFINPPVALSASQAYAPVMHADQNITVPRATSTSQAYAPAPRGDQSITIVRAASSSQAYAPEIRGGSLSHQRITKTTNTDLTYKDFRVQDGYSSDATYPATVSGGTSMVVSGAGACTISARAIITQRSGSWTGFFAMYVNGSQVGSIKQTSGDGTYTVGPVSVTVAGGDIVELRGRSEDDYYYVSLKSGSYVDLTPV